MKRALFAFLTLLVVASVGPDPARAQLAAPAGPAPYNDLVLQQILTMPQAGGYSASHLASERLRGAVSLSSTPGLSVTPTQAQPSYCSGATYLVFLKTLDALTRRGVVQLDDRVLSALLIAGQRDGEGIWGRWNANGPGTAKLFYEMGLGRNFSEFSQARPGDFMKIWWSAAVGRREHGHSVIYLGSEQVNGVDSVRFWSSNVGVGYSVKTVPRAKISAAVFSRLSTPENLARVPGSMPRVDPYLAGLLSKDSSQEQVRDECGM